MPLLAILVGALFEGNEQGKISTLERVCPLEYEVEKGGGEDANSTAGEVSSSSNKNGVDLGKHPKK